jgi:hypothetical protein
MRSASVVSLVCGVVGWYALRYSFGVTTGDATSYPLVVAYLATSAALGVAGFRLGVRGLRIDRSSSGRSFAGLGIAVCLLLLAFSGGWGLFVLAAYLQRTA